jgi:hypothetical protein
MKKKNDSTVKFVMSQALSIQQEYDNKTHQKGSSQDQEFSVLYVCEKTFPTNAVLSDHLKAIHENKTSTNLCITCILQVPIMNL